MPIDCSSARRTDPAVDSVEFSLTLPIDSGQLKSMLLGFATIAIFTGSVVDVINIDDIPR